MTVSFDFSDKTVLVTGGSKGIGRAIAEQFRDAGAKVAIVARPSKELQAFQNNPRSLAIEADLSGEQSAAQVLLTVEQAFGGLDILINNVGGAICYGNLWEVETQQWQDAFNLNVMSMVHFSKAATDLLRKSKTPRIINVSSISGIEPGFYNPHYTATKAATINFSKYLANLLASENILVNCVCPGSIQSAAWDYSLQQIASKKELPLEKFKNDLCQAEEAKIPLGRMGQCADIAPLVLFLASKEACWITGSCFHINGGKKRGIH